MAEAKDIPEDRLHDVLLRRFWPSHPLGAPIFGTDETVRSLAKRQLVSRFASIFRPERTAIVAAGALSPDDFRRRLEKARRLRRQRAAGREPVPVSRRAAAPRARACAFHIPRPDLSQTHVLAGVPALPHVHPLVPAIWIASTVLGGGVSSRLWRDVRERRGLAYQVGTGLTLHGAGGISLIDAATAPRNLARLVRALGRIVGGLREGGVTRSELRRAKDQIASEVSLSVESTVARREAGARDWLYRGRPHGADAILAEVEAVTPSDVEEAIGRVWGAAAPWALGVSGPDLAGATVDDLAGELAA